MTLDSDSLIGGHPSFNTIREPVPARATRRTTALSAAWCMTQGVARIDKVAMLYRSASKEVVKALLAAGPRGRHPSIKDVNKHGLTPLGEALVAGRCDVADLLVSEASVGSAEGGHPGCSTCTPNFAINQREHTQNSRHS